jgi:hypothetical protein
MSEEEVEGHPTEADEWQDLFKPEQAIKLHPDCESEYIVTLENGSVEQVIAASAAEAAKKFEGQALRSIKYHGFGTRQFLSQEELAKLKQ